MDVPETRETNMEAVELGKTFEEVLPPLEGEETEYEGRFTWRIERWSELRGEKHYSPRVQVGRWEWDLLVFPHGNSTKGIAMYLAPHPVQAEADWYVCAQFAIVLSRPGDDARTQLVSRSQHRFNAVDKDWGFSNLIELEHLRFATRGRPSGFLSGDQLNVTVYVRVLRDPTGVLWHNFANYDSKKVTGYVGLKNQGATCYLNSLLQSYYFTKYFRKLVYQIPTEGETPANSVSLALQRAFFQLQRSSEPLDTCELTRSFGWDTGDAFTQHDVQELNRILMDRLENKMKGTEVEGKLNGLFVGKMKSYIKCVNVDYESSRVEDFWDIQLNVKGLKGLQQSFENYIEVEMMDGENQYAAQGHGLQDAKKGVLFESFPPVLHLQLKRFEYDFNYDQLIKINDRYEFPESIDLSPYLDPEVQEDSPANAKYNLHGVLVHTGDISTGHYYAMIKPGLEDAWYRFDDDKVWRVTKKQVFEQNFGFDKLSEYDLRSLTKEQYQNYLIARQTSAYMLVYIREDMESTILQEVTDADVPEYIVNTIEEELKERERFQKEREEMHLYAKVYVHSMKNFIHYQGYDLSPNERSKLYIPELHGEDEYALSVKLPKNTKVKEIYTLFNEKLGIKRTDLVRYWTINYRTNTSLRLDLPILPSYDEMTLESLMTSQGRNTAIDLFVEESYFDLGYIHSIWDELDTSQNFADVLQQVKDMVNEGLLPSSETYIREKDQTQILLLVKKFDIGAQRLTGLGHILLSQYSKLSQLGTILSKLLNISEEITFVEEYGPDGVETVDNHTELVRTELMDGDIITFAINPAEESLTYPFYSSIIEYYDYLRNRVKLKFTKTMSYDEEYVLPDNDGPNEFEFWISVKCTNEELARVVSKYVNVSPEYLRLYAIYSNGKFSMESGSLLTDYLVKRYNRNSIPPFGYEVLTIPLKELEHLRSIKFYWLEDSYVHFQSYEFRVANSSTVSEFLDKVQARIGFDDEKKKQVLLWTNSDFRFQGILSLDSKIESIDDSFLIFARVLPEEVSVVYHLEQLPSAEATDKSSENDLSISKHSNAEETIVIVQQYFKDWENKHGISFLFTLLPGETFPETKKRLHERFGLGQKEFSKIKLGILYNTEEGPIFKSLSSDDEEVGEIVLHDLMNNLDFITMDHPDRSRNQTHQDRPMMIKN
ncbi:AGL357Wp [Eremothecium gossypii ATCC 10895]|uniref:ubiquitinyl hydrolase 1 n=1 Tax=Eremothecium gossypii (strain ATCC 10895 / CBS 109.51 / FGSC 9923 / NRRL Y-1056) TaxID=284811 RepID=Q751P6_EREGS|nr:AGL357Wp [Eremothecium gossypii ATCC 10895]AAS54134.1 AGL357Wp [Eremothecium gossypii ATCC 10895]AEY98460.1 FAGL357Wp [Eremothecium gossypii FDAG1]